MLIGLTNHESLETVWPDPNKGEWSVAELGQASQVGPGLRWEFLKAFALGGVGSPPRQGFIDRHGAIPRLAVCRRQGVDHPVDVVASADLQGVVLVESIDIGHRETCDAIDHAREAKQDGIKPSAAARAACRRTELAAEAMEVFRETFVAGWKRAGANACRVGLANPDDPLDRGGWQASASA